MAELFSPTSKLSFVTAQAPPRSLAQSSLLQASPQRPLFGIASLFSSGLGSSSLASSSPTQHAEPEFVSAFQVPERVSTSSRSNFEDYVLDFIREPRVAVTKDRQRDTEEDGQSVMNAVLFDLAGPVTLALWRNTCSVFLDTTRAQPANAILPFLCLRVVALPRNDWNGNIFTPSVNCSQRIRLEPKRERSSSKRAKPPHHS